MTINEDAHNHILCAYCSQPFTCEMLTELYMSEGSYTPDVVSSTMNATIDIKCKNCNKIVYKKEISKTLEEYDQLRWNK